MVRGPSELCKPLASQSISAGQALSPSAGHSYMSTKLCAHEKVGLVAWCIHMARAFNRHRMQPFESYWYY